jgi:Zn-dependent protease with chaperone function
MLSENVNKSLSLERGGKEGGKEEGDYDEYEEKAEKANEGLRLEGQIYYYIIIIIIIINFRIQSYFLPHPIIDLRIRLLRCRLAAVVKLTLP